VSIFHCSEVPGLFITPDDKRQSSRSSRDRSQARCDTQKGCPSPLQTLQQARCFQWGCLLHQAAPVHTGHLQGNDLDSIHDNCSGKQTPKWVTPRKRASRYCKLQDCEGEAQSVTCNSKLQERERTEYCNTDLPEKATAGPTVAPVTFQDAQLFLL